MIRKNVILPMLMLVSSISHAAPYIYVANNGNNAVNVIDAATDSLVTTIALPTTQDAAEPTCIAISPDGKTVSVAQSNLNSSGPSYRITVSVIDATLGIPALISTTEVTILDLTTTNPFGIAYTPDSNSVYITNMGLGNSDTGAIYLINDIGTSSPTLSPTPITSIDNPSAIAIGNTPNGIFAYIGKNNLNSIGIGMYDMNVNTNMPNLVSSMIVASYDSIQGIAMAPDGLTAYAIRTSSQSSNLGRLYIIDTASNSLTNNIDLGNTSVPVGIVASPDGKYLYIADNQQNQIFVIPTDNPSNISTTFSTTDPIALTISSDSNTLYVIDMNGTVTSYRVPAGTQENSIALGGSARQSSIVIGQLDALPPSSISGCKTKNVFLLQTDYINNITWTAPEAGSPSAYAIYRDPALTQLAAIVPANGPLQYFDHGRNPTINYSYYIVSVDASGNQSTPAVISVTESC